MYIADMLSRAYLHQKAMKEVPQYYVFQLEDERKLSEDISTIEQSAYMHLSEGTHDQVKSATQGDPVLLTLANTVLLGWPDRYKV